MSKIYICTLGILISTILSMAHAADFCVTSSLQLQQALTTTSSNAESDNIRIATGSYTTLATGFAYEGASEDFDLEISGGWSEFSGDPCGQQLNAIPFNTVLRSNILDATLYIRTGDNGELSISNLSFVEANSAPGAVVIVGLTADNILFERNVFFDNSTLGAAFSISSHGKTYVRNNLFVANHNTSGSTGAANLQQVNGLGVYFTNNTVIFNTTVTGPPNVAGLEIGMYGTSKAYIANNILWNNDDNDLDLGGDGYKYLFNNDIGTQTGDTADESANNISVPPVFSGGLFDFTPAFGSPLANGGLHPANVLPAPFEDDWALGATDILGNTRIRDGQVEIGAYEADLDLIFANGFETIVD